MRGSVTFTLILFISNASAAGRGMPTARQRQRFQFALQFTFGATSSALTCLRFGDNFIRNWSYWFIAWDYMYRRLVKHAREVAVQLIESGNERNDPRALGLANWLLGWIDIIGDRYDDAISHADECLRVAIAPLDRLQGEIIKAIAGIFHGNVQQGLLQLDALIQILEGLGSYYHGAAGMRGAAIALTGRLSEGIRAIRQTIARLDPVEDRGNATWTRIILAEIYIQILSGRKSRQLLSFSKISGQSAASFSSATGVQPRFWRRPRPTSS